MNYFQRFKEKWDIQSNFQLIIIFIVFSVTGRAALYVRKFVFEWLGIDNDTPLYFVIPMYIITILPSYQILLMIVGTLFGQYKFFLKFQKKSVGRLFIRNRS